MNLAPRTFTSLLVTGGCGFIGANLIRYLLDEAGFDGRIVNLDKLTYAGNPENLAGVPERHPERYRFVHGDICDPAAVQDLMTRYAVDAVCHLAAESHVDRSIAGPQAFVDTNVNGTLVLLEAARRQGPRLKLFHHVSTDEVYGSLGTEGRFTEETAYAPNSPYSASKAASDHLVRAYHATYDLPVTVSNCSNNYGPYQFPEKLIPLMVLNALEARPLPVYGRGRNVRDWLFVTDHCAAIWKIMRRGSDGRTYNVGGLCERTNLAVVEAICDAVDRRHGATAADSARTRITFVKDRPGHDFRYAIDCSRIRRELGWSPTVDFDTGLQRTIDWYVEHPEWVRRVQSGAYREWIARHYDDDGIAARE